MLRVRAVTNGFTGAPGYNNFYFEGTESTVAGSAHQAVVAFFQSMASVLSNQVAVTVESEVPVIDPASGSITGLHNIPQQTVSGTWGTAHSPSGVTLVCQWLTGTFVGGRQVRGRSFISGLGDVGEGSQSVPAGVITDAETACSGLVAATLADLQVYSPTHGVSHTVTGSNVWNRFGLMRSRRD